MKHRRHVSHTSDGDYHWSSSTALHAKPERRRGWRILVIILLALALILGVGRAMLPRFVRDYVNRTLDRSPVYAGDIGTVQIHLWRGAYSIHNVRLNKTTGNVPVPFFAAARLDFSVQWNALLHGRIVGRILLQDPEMNFVDGGAESETQTGAGGPWLQIIRDLFPFKINSAVIKNGSIHFLTYKKHTPVDVYLTQFEGTIDNLSNIRDDTNPLVATVRATGVAMDHAKVEFAMTLDPFSYRPTFHMAARLLGLDATKLNDLTLAYGKFDFERGWLDLVIEADSKEGQMTGYVKPLFRDLKVFSAGEDLRNENVLEYFWQALVGAATSVFKNHPRDQFGTLIPFRGDFSATTTVDVLRTVGNILRNAFVRAYLPRLEKEQQFDNIEFGPAEFIETVAGDGV